MEQLVEKVTAALAAVKHIPQERITLDTSFESLGLDSLDKVTLLFELEKQLQLTIPDEHLNSVRNVRDLTGEIAKLIASSTITSPAAKEAI